MAFTCEKDPNCDCIKNGMCKTEDWLYCGQPKQTIVDNRKQDLFTRCIDKMISARNDKIEGFKDFPSFVEDVLNYDESFIGQIKTFLNNHEEMEKAKKEIEVLKSLRNIAINKKKES